MTESKIQRTLARLTEHQTVLTMLHQHDNAAMLNLPIRLLTEHIAELSAKAGDDVVSHFEDETGVWTMLELTAAAEDSDEWHTVATLLLSDVEAADLARRLTDRGHS